VQLCMEGCVYDCIMVYVGYICNEIIYVYTLKIEG